VSPVAKSPDEAKAQSEKAQKGNAQKIEKNKKHYNDLVIDFGAPGSEGGKFQIAFDQYGDLILQELVVNDKDEIVSTQEKFFWVASDGVSYTTLNASQAIKKLKEGYKGNFEGLRKLLYDKKFIDKTEYQTQDETAFNKGLLRAARNYSVNQIQNFTVNGKTKFAPFNNWLTGLKSVGDGSGEPDLPVRDINLLDRDVVRALVEDVYMNEIGNAPDEAWVKEKTDYYMNQIKKGTLTTVKKVGGEVVRKNTAGFSESRARAELTAKLPTEKKTEYEQAQSLNFLSFLAQMEQR